MSGKNIINYDHLRPALWFGLETVALTERQEAEMEVAELKMLPISLGVTRMDNVRNEYIRGTLQVARLERKQEKHGYIGRRILRM